MRLPVVLFHLVDIHASGTSFFFFFSFSLLFEGSLNEALSFNSSCLIVRVTGVRKDSHVFFFLSHTS